MRLVALRQEHDAGCSDVQPVHEEKRLARILAAGLQEPSTARAADFSSRVEVAIETPAGLSSATTSELSKRRAIAPDRITEDTHMTLAAGSRLGPYEILAPIGAGGDGRGLQAPTPRLDRPVAVKVLAPHLAASAEVRQRFEREARTISKLSHAHICALYDVGREGEVEYLVMELLEGESLAERLARGPLSLEQTLRSAPRSPTRSTRRTARGSSTAT